MKTPTALRFRLLLASASLAAFLTSAQAATYSLAGDFSYTENDENSLWSFRMDDYANNPPTFLPLLTSTSLNANDLWGTAFETPPQMWSEGTGYWGIGKNTSGVEQNASGVAWAPDEVLLHPKGGGSPARLVICWRAPRSMLVNVHYAFRKTMSDGDGIGYELRARIGGVDTEIIGFGNGYVGSAGSGVSREQLGLSFGAGDQLFFRIDTWANAGGDITGAAIEITEVVGPVVIDTDPSGGMVAEGGNFTFNVAATGAAGYAWYKDGGLIPGATGTSYSVIDARTSDAGAYTVVATNATESVTSAPAVLTVTARPTYAAVVLTENFNGYSGNQNNRQYQTGLKVSYGGSVPGWGAAGGGAIHAVDRTGSGNYAPMIWQDNVLTLTTGIPANESGETYFVEFVAAPATYSEGGQATTETDGMVIDVLRGDNTVLATYTCLPGAWGTQSFNPFSFEYEGDGSGDVRLRVGPLAASGHFGGAIDNLRVATDYVRPTPPEILDQPVGGDVAGGCNFSFSVLGTGALGYYWLKDGNLVPGATTPSYSIIDATTSDAAAYTVVLTNAVGSVTSAPAVLTVTAPTAYATVLLAENFSAYTGNQNNRQYQTGLKVSHSGSVPGWNKAGGGAIHAVDRTGTGNYAAMIWQDNVLTLASAVPANEPAVTYYVDFTAAPATYSEATQATTETDGIVIEVLRGDYTVLASHTCYPGAWGNQSFAPFTFQYEGDGSGPVLVRVGPLAPSGHFGGAIDNLRVATDYVPSTPPEITLDPVGDTVLEGNDFAFSILANGLPNYQWYKDGGLIPGATNAGFTISDVKLADAGTYTAVAANASGSVTSAPAILIVTPIPVYTTYAETVLMDNPIHYYPLDETSDTVAADLGSLAVLGGTYTGGFTLGRTSVTPALGNCVQLDGLPGTYVDLGLFHPGEAVTVEVWANLDSTASHSPSYHDLVGRMDGSYIIDFAPGDVVNFAAFNDSGVLAKVAGATPSARGVWHHLVGVFSGGTATVYVDGVKGGEQTVGGVLQNLGPTPDRVLIGASRDGMNNSFNWKGYIDEVALYDTALSAAQIRAHYRAAQPASQMLTIQRATGGAVMISWPSFPSGYVLQSAASVTGAYENYTGSIAVQGDQYTAEVPLESAPRFFRLFKP